MSNLSLYSERCWIKGVLRPAGIIIENGIIISVSDIKPEGATDLGNKVIMPGVIDAHIHVNEPGRADWEGFESATKAAAAGGITTIVDMPLNASPVTTTVNAFNKKLQSTFNKLHVNCGFYGGLVPSNIQEIIPLLHSGVLGIKCFLTHSGIDEFPDVTEKEINQAMNLMAGYGLPLLAHCEISDEIGRAGIESDPGNYNSYVLSRPPEWEINAVKLMIKLCRKNNCKTHIVHVSSSASLNEIESAKKERLPLTAETCPHYIYFNAETIPDNSTIFKCAPPIRDHVNNIALKKSLRSGVLDLLGSDHSPAPPEIKEILSGNLLKAWGGIAGLQFLLPASWTALKMELSLEEFIPLLTEKPALLTGIAHRKGKIEPGYDADIICWDPDATFTVEENAILHKHKISPYIGEQLSGVVIQTIVNGKIAFIDNKPTEQRNGMIVLNDKFKHI